MLQQSPPSLADFYSATLAWNCAAVDTRQREARDPVLGWFGYDWDGDGVVTVHFTDKRHGGLGAGERQRDGFKRMMENVRTLHPDARAIRVRSWVLGEPSARRFLPRAVIDAAREMKEYRLTGLGRWGQFVDQRNRTKPAMKAEFMQRLAAARAARRRDIFDVFPKPIYEAVVPIEAVYRELGIVEG